MSLKHMYSLFDKKKSLRQSSGNSALKLSSEEQKVSESGESVTTPKSLTHSSPRNELKSSQEHVSSEFIESVKSSKSPRDTSHRRELKKSDKDKVINEPSYTSTHTTTSTTNNKLLVESTESKKTLKSKELIRSKKSLDEHRDNSALNNIPLIRKLSLEKVEENNFRESLYAPKKLYDLDLQLIIAERTDERFHAKVGAYFDTNLRRQPKPNTVLTGRIPFQEYFKYVAEELNAHQRKKFRTIEALVKIIRPVYAQESRTEEDHNKFCIELLDIILLCMNTEAPSDTVMDSSNKSAKEVISIFWHSALFGVKCPGIEEYNNLIITLINQFDQGYLKRIRNIEIFELNKSRTKETQLSCVSWDYFNVLCDSNCITGKNYNLFITSYKEHCHGLAKHFIYIPDIWLFIRNQLDSDTKLDSTYRDTLKKLDKMLLNSTAFKDFHPKSISGHEIGFMHIL